MTHSDSVSKPAPILSPVLSPVLSRLDPAGIQHGFFTRMGGVSAGVYDSLNCGYGSGDDAALVRENRRRVAAHFGLAAPHLITAYQHHSALVTVVTPENLWRDPAAAAKADAMVTTMPGIGLGILTADCAPVLFADAESRVIAAAHAGWRGALAGITDQVVDSMCRLGARRESIHAAIGPCIAQASYEVGADFLAHFVTAHPLNERFFIPSLVGKPGHYHFALAAYLAARLSAAGVNHVSIQGDDTAALPGQYFSWRRSCWENQPLYGRMIAVIALA
ncbi:MAG: peptidoglycan editing factor PgeF [Candidatus Symbiobacter sp.]|nr:peptidoglycan editing factor PgeF [Candidatus Symbiobacter sp.]